MVSAAYERSSKLVYPGVLGGPWLVPAADRQPRLSAAADLTGAFPRYYDVTEEGVIEMTLRRVSVLVGAALIALVLASCDLFQPPDVGTDLGEAIDIVVNEVLPDAVPPGATFLCARMDEVLPPGSVIEEDAPGQRVAPVAEPKRVTIGEESFLFFLDLAPGTFYEHPVRYILVGRSGGHQVIDAVWWPRVNGEIVDEFRDLNPDDDHIIAGNAVLGAAVGALMQFDLGIVSRVQREGFLVVQGLLQDENLFDASNDTYLNGVAFFNSYKSGFSELDGLVMGDADGVLDAIDAMVEKKLSPITIYIIAHGGVDGVRLGGVWITAQQFHDKFAEHPGTLFNFLLGSCHSGSFIDDLSSLSNVRVAQAACAADGGVWPDWDNHSGMVDYNPEDSGSEWLSSILAAAAAIVEDHWAEVLAAAAAVNVPATSVLLDAAWLGALGQHSGYGLTNDLDLSHRVGAADPQRYRSWFHLIPIYPIRSTKP